MKTLIAISKYIEFDVPSQKFRTKELYQNEDGSDTFYNIGYKLHDRVDDTPDYEGARSYIENTLGTKNDLGFPITVLFEDENES